MKPLFPLEPVGGEGLLPTGKHGGRDSIRSKVFEEDGGGLDEFSFVIQRFEKLGSQFVMCL